MGLRQKQFTGLFCSLLHFLQHFKTLEDAVLQTTSQRDTVPLESQNFPPTFAIQPVFIKQ